MKSSIFCILFAVAGLVPGLRADEPAIIAKARAYLGTEEALNAIRSIHMAGSMESVVVGDPASKQTATIDIVFQKPQQERLTVVTADKITRTGLDGFNAWHLIQDRDRGGPPDFDPKKFQQLRISDPTEIRTLQADTFENLYYYRGIEQWGGSIQDVGPATIDGVACEKVLMKHTDQIVYTRYFDQATGRLVYTESYAGANIHEQGEQVVAGVKFPKTIIIDQAAGKKPQRTTLTLDSIAVNDPFPESYFATPQPWIPPAAPSGPAAPAPSAVQAEAPAAAPSAAQP